MDRSTTSIVTDIPLNVSLITEEENMNGKDYTTSYVLILIALVIITGNCLVILTVKSFAKRLVADIFIFSLALLDVVQTLISILIAIVFKFTLLHKRTGAKHRGISHILCQTQGWFSVTTQLQSAFIVTMITLERFIAVSRPFLYNSYVKPRRAVKTLAFLFVISAGFSSTPLLGWGEYLPLPKLALCMFNYNSSYAILIVVIGYADLALVSYCFIAIRVSLGKFMKRQTYFARRRDAIGGPQMAADKEVNISAAKLTKDGAKCIEQSKRLLKVSAMVSFLFYFSWLPLMAAITFSQITQQSNDVFSLVATLMPLTSSLMNPLVYFFSWERYKRSYIKIVKRFINCCPYQRSIATKDLTRVPGRNSTIRNLVRNSGLLGRLDLVECREEDICCAEVSTPGPQIHSESAPSGEIPASYSESKLNHSDNTYPGSSGDLRRYSLDDNPKAHRRFTTSGYTQTDCSRFLEKPSSPNDGMRRHTIGEFPGNTNGSLDCTATENNQEKESSLGNGSTRNRQIIGNEGEIDGLGSSNGLGILSLDRVRWDCAYQNGEPRDKSGFRIKHNRKSWYKTRRLSKYEKGRGRIECSDTGSVSQINTEKDLGERELPEATHSYHSNSISDTNNLKRKIEKDDKFSDYCPITQRIQDYITSLVGGEEFQDSRNDGDFCQGDGVAFPGKFQAKNNLQIRNVIGKRSSTRTTKKYSAKKKKRVTLSLRHVSLSLRHHDNKRVTRNSANVTSEILRKFGRREDGGKCSQGLSNFSEKHKNVSRNHNDEAQSREVGKKRENITKEKDTLIWTYL